MCVLPAEEVVSTHITHCSIAAATCDSSVPTQIACDREPPAAPGTPCVALRRTKIREGPGKHTTELGYLQCVRFNRPSALQHCIHFSPTATLFACRAQQVVTFLDTKKVGTSGNEDGTEHNFQRQRAKIKTDTGTTGWICVVNKQEQPTLGPVVIIAPAASSSTHAAVNQAPPWAPMQPAPAVIVQQTLNPVAAQPPPATVQEFLSSIGLTGYEATLAGLGATEVPHMADLTEDDLQAMMKPLEVRRFLKAVAKSQWAQANGVATL